MDKVYDIIVLGAGPAGLAAASYAGRARMDTLLIEGTKDGGQIVITNEIENYPGSLEEESGPSLIARMTKQVEKFGADRVTDTIVDVELEETPERQPWRLLCKSCCYRYRCFPTSDWLPR